MSRGREIKSAIYFLDFWFELLTRLPNANMIVGHKEEFRKDTNTKAKNSTSELTL